MRSQGHRGSDSTGVYPPGTLSTQVIQQQPRASVQPDAATDSEHRTMSFVLDAVARHASEHRDAIALTDDRDELTYEALWRESEEWAATLRGLLEHPPTIATCLENSALWVLLDLALIR